MDFSYFWYLGFKLFIFFKHPTLYPLKILKRAINQLAITKNAPIKRQGSSTQIPKKIWIYWAQGWNEAPELVQICRKSWIERNPAWEVILLDKMNLETYICIDIDVQGKQISHAAFSDVLRVQLLAKYGGVWADATTLCSAPLDTWLPSLMNTGFFAFRKQKTTLASWFLATEKNNEMIRKWEIYARRYWRFARTAHRYFYIHYLFEYLLSLDKKARLIWLETPDVSSDGPYQAQWCLKGENTDEDTCITKITHPDSPIHKLDWRLKITPRGIEQLQKSIE